METLTSLKHQNEVARYIDKHYPDWSFSNFKKKEVDVCDNGDVVYNSNTIIKTNIKRH